MSSPPDVFGDSEIRPALRLRLLEEHAPEPDTLIMEELGLCRGHVRIDMAVVNGALHGYEIKSDLDSLRRLSNQVDTYSKVLDRATLVVGRRHLTEATAVVPRWWGVLRVDSCSCGPRFTQIRRPRRNRSRDPRSLIELLWLEDAMALLEEHGDVRGVRGKPRRFVWDRLCRCLTVDEIAAAVRQQLKARARHADAQQQT